MITRVSTAVCENRKKKKISHYKLLCRKGIILIPNCTLTCQKWTNCSITNNNIMILLNTMWLF